MTSPSHDTYVQLGVHENVTFISPCRVFHFMSFRPRDAVSERVLCDFRFGGELKCRLDVYDTSGTKDRYQNGCFFRDRDKSSMYP